MAALTQDDIERLENSQRFLSDVLKLAHQKAGDKAIVQHDEARAAFAMNLFGIYNNAKTEPEFELVRQFLRPEILGLEFFNYVDLIKQSALHLAIVKHDTKTANIFLDILEENAQTAELFRTDNARLSPFQTAISEQETSIALRLIDIGRADVRLLTLADNCGHTPLFFAVHNKNEAVIATLITELEKHPKLFIRSERFLYDEIIEMLKGFGKTTADDFVTRLERIKSVANVGVNSDLLAELEKAIGKQGQLPQWQGIVTPALVKVL